jgi:hypothetical protein
MGSDTSKYYWAVFALFVLGANVLKYLRNKRIIQLTAKWGNEVLEKSDNRALLVVLYIFFSLASFIFFGLLLNGHI